MKAFKMNYSELTAWNLTLREGSKAISEQGPCVMGSWGQLY
jgi:hypothetical protein